MTNNEMKANRFRRYHIARQKLVWINARIAEGRDVFISTYTKATKVNAKTVKSFEKKHTDLFRATKTGLYIARGKSWDCIDGCKITAR